METADSRKGNEGKEREWSSYFSHEQTPRKSVKTIQVRTKGIKISFTMSCRLNKKAMD